jgi:hypothetical protein
MNTERESVGNIINIVLKAVALGMAVTVIVTSILGLMDPQVYITMLAVGVFGLAVTALDKE